GVESVSNRGAAGAGLGPRGLIFAPNHPVILELATADGVAANDPIAVSVVAPAHDEAPNLVRLLAEVRAALDPLGIAWELIVVDDGSGDETPALLARLDEADPHLLHIRLAPRRVHTSDLA